jgi:hypothetical protein
LIDSLIDALVAQPHRRIVGKALAQVMADLWLHRWPSSSATTPPELFVGVDPATVLTVVARWLVDEHRRADICSRSARSAAAPSKSSTVLDRVGRRSPIRSDRIGADQQSRSAHPERGTAS